MANTEMFYARMPPNRVVALFSVALGEAESFPPASEA